MESQTMTFQREWNIDFSIDAGSDNQWWISTTVLLVATAPNTSMKRKLSIENSCWACEWNSVKSCERMMQLLPWLRWKEVMLSQVTSRKNHTILGAARWLVDRWWSDALFWVCSGSALSFHHTEFPHLRSETLFGWKNLKFSWKIRFFGRK